MCDARARVWFSSLPTGNFSKRNPDPVNFFVFHCDHGRAPDALDVAESAAIAAKAAAKAAVNYGGGGEGGCLGGKTGASFGEGVGGGGGGRGGGARGHLYNAATEEHHHQNVYATVVDGTVMMFTLHDCNAPF